MSSWEALDCEIWYWAESGRTATLWWRDDDATWPSPELTRLLTLSAETATPVALAVVPRDAAPDLGPHLARYPLASVLVHGYGHVNHAPPGEDQDEYGPHRSRKTRLAELAESRSRLESFARFTPVLTPPWNRVPYDLLEALPGIGLTGLSAWGPRAEQATGVNVHVDVMNWQTGRFAGQEAALGQLVNHLTARRTGTLDEPTGLMTHHAYHDDGVWKFLRELLDRTRPRPGVTWLTAGEAFG